MEIIIGIILILFLFAALAVIVVVNRKKATADKEEEVAATPALDCCGAHEICEFDEIKMDENKIIYYDDEELDAYKNIPENEYTDKHIDEFREVLYTLKIEEIMYWLLSLERRKINFPTILIEEARMLMAEA